SLSATERGTTMPAFPSAPSLAINMNVAPGGFRDWLKQANSRLSAQSITHRLHVPDELRFWIFLEFGTAPHEIKAKYAKALHFGIGDKELFRDHVNHPGMRPKLVYRAIRDEWQQYLSTLHITEELLNLSTGGFGL